MTVSRPLARSPEAIGPGVSLVFPGAPVATAQGTLPRGVFAGPASWPGSASDLQAGGGRREAGQPYPGPAVSWGRAPGARRRAQLKECCVSPQWAALEISFPGVTAPRLRADRYVALNDECE